ncbi:MAG: RNA methyltransferase [Gammaproteobacteria bacterium]|nr:RNA methyltransferase [Gammaproteobacteria bacterium]
MFDSKKIRFVLVNTTHPGNIGASARAIKNMGFNDLWLVNPLKYPHSEATARSSGAEDLLENARVVSSLQEAVSDCNLICGTSSRSRSLTIPLITPRECAEKTVEHLGKGSTVAIIFGQERMGLTNDELSMCHYHLTIPCNLNFPSLNLAAAVQIIAYELNLGISAFDLPIKPSEPLVNAEDMEKFYGHLESMLINIQFLNPSNPRQMMRKLKRLFNRASLEKNEMNILRGILSTIDKVTKV